jgi:hypothetical protein
MPILVMGITAFIIFVIVMAIMIAAGLEERQNAAEEAKPRVYTVKPVKPAS